ncbi:hypothetical protein PYW08_012123 [Mythimna loreyi]|uniref:Uncharacterized protein n=1 Tax=Mythimna loreyi TaxID=667449 RepID=A0ACC2PZE2_9NEOP|nr:hypothetical protein PYW08_012123 [Mythimna loreyi]
MFGKRVLTVLWLFLEIASPFSWDLVVGTGKQLKFYDNGICTHTKKIPTATKIVSVAYDPVNFRVLFVDENYPNTTVSSYDISSKKIQTLLTRESDGLNATTIDYDPVTQLLLLKEAHKIYSFSLNPASSKEAHDGYVLEKLNYFCGDIAVDSCGGYVYCVTDFELSRIGFDDYRKEVLINDSAEERKYLAIDAKMKKIYWTEITYANHIFRQAIESANFDGKNRTTLHSSELYAPKISLTVSGDFLYWLDENMNVWQLPKNPSGREPKKLFSTPKASFPYRNRLAANYKIEEIQGTESCEAAQGLISNNSKPESTESICQNYCLEGDCSVSPDGTPKCRCDDGYSGERCEVNTCRSYCLNSGICSVQELDQPVCQCPEGYEGSRCEVPAYLMKCVQAVSMLKEVLSADVPPVTLKTAEQSTCASNVV